MQCRSLPGNLFLQARATDMLNILTGLDDQSAILVADDLTCSDPSQYHEHPCLDWCGF